MGAGETLGDTHVASAKRPQRRRAEARLDLGARWATGLCHASDTARCRVRDNTQFSSENLTARHPPAQELVCFLVNHNASPG